MITPAISVLGAMEGLTTATPVFGRTSFPSPSSCSSRCFSSSHAARRGSARIFGPVMVRVVHHHRRARRTLRSRESRMCSSRSNPAHAWDFFHRNGFHGFLVLGSVFLVVTGGEALYADMGHFGKRPIRVAWFAFVQPALLLNYFGQGALLLGNPKHAEQPFYLLAPDWLLYPLVALATLAAVIASQALISAVFSLTRQAVQLGYSPRMAIRYTSAETMGQIYIPQVNWALMVATIAHRPHVPLLERARRGIRHRGDHDDGDHDGAGVRHRASGLGMEPDRGRRCRSHIHRGGPRVLRRQRAEDRAGGWVPLAHRLGRVPDHDDLEARARDRRRPAARACLSFFRVPEGHRGESAAPRPGHGRLHDRHRDWHAAHAAAQPGTQQGAAPECRAADGRHL